MAIQIEHPSTARDYVEAWDRGDILTTLEMGGIGPGYEQAIQGLVVELLRDNLDKPLPADEDEPAWEAWGDDTVSCVDKQCGGFSGAQVGAAKWLAIRYLNEGPRAFFERAEIEHPDVKDRKTLVSNAWPRVESLS